MRAYSWLIGTLIWSGGLGVAGRVLPGVVTDPGPGHRLQSGSTLQFALAFVGFFLPLLVLGLRLAGPIDAMPARIFAAAGVTLVVAAPFEVLVDRAFLVALGEPGWVYRVAPLHGGATSAIGVVMWPLYGAFVYLVQKRLKARPSPPSVFARSALGVVEATVLEVAANLFSLTCFGTWFFYYTAPDVGHYTSFQVAPPYLVAGWVGTRLLDAVDHVRHPVRLGAAAWALGALGLALSPAA